MCMKVEDNFAAAEWPRSSRGPTRNMFPDRGSFVSIVQRMRSLSENILGGKGFNTGPIRLVVLRAEARRLFSESVYNKE